jgi:hypothetical protein
VSRVGYLRVQAKAAEDSKSCLERRAHYLAKVEGLTLEVTRRHGSDGRPLFCPFCFHLGATDEDQEVALAPGAREPDHGGERPWERVRRSNFGSRTPGLKMKMTTTQRAVAGTSSPQGGVVSSNASASRQTRAGRKSVHRGVSAVRAPGREATAITGTGTFAGQVPPSVPAVGQAKEAGV